MAKWFKCSIKDCNRTNMIYTVDFYNVEGKPCCEICICKIILEKYRIPEKIKQCRFCAREITLKHKYKHKRYCYQCLIFLLGYRLWKEKNE